MQLDGLGQTSFGAAFLMEKMYVNIYFLTLVSFHALLLWEVNIFFLIIVCAVDLQKLPDFCLLES